MEIARKKTYRANKKTTVQLTSLLDLLFVMIFVSLMQEKITPEMREKIKKVKAKGTITKIQTKVKPKPKKIKKVKINPKPVPVKVLKTFAIEAIFYFKPTSSNPSIPSGTFKMFGSFDEKSRELRLGGVSWIERPKGYDMVPLSGVIKDGDQLFTGKIEFPGCKTFNLKRTQKLNNSPISGIWEGEYDCSQGLTGLTLTIK